MSADGSGEQWWSVGSGRLIAVKSGVAGLLSWNLMTLAYCWRKRSAVRIWPSCAQANAQDHAQHQFRVSSNLSLNIELKLNLNRNMKLNLNTSLSIRTTIRKSTGRDESDHRFETAWRGLSVSMTKLHQKRCTNDKVGRVLVEDQDCRR